MHFKNARNASVYAVFRAFFTQSLAKLRIFAALAFVKIFLHEIPTSAPPSGCWRNTCAAPGRTQKQPLRCFATPNRYIKSETLNLSALAEFFYVNICVFLCCIVLRFT